MVLNPILYKDEALYDNEEYITINHTNPEYILTPTSTELYNSSMEISYMFQIDTLNGAYVLQITGDLCLREMDWLRVYVCNTGSILYDTAIFNFQHPELYTQEEAVCIKFNSTSGSFIKKYYWIIHLLLEPLTLTFSRQVSKIFLKTF